MVSPIPYHSFKNLRFGQSYSATVVPVIVSILLILKPGLNFFLVGVIYVLSGPAGMFWRWRTGRELLPVEQGARRGLPARGHRGPRHGRDDEGQRPCAKRYSDEQSTLFFSRSSNA